MERQTFCCLYIWDSLLSRQLDRIPPHPGRLIHENWLQLASSISNRKFEDGLNEKGRNAPDPFTERLLQAQLADFWRMHGPVPRADYDVINAEERYDKFGVQYAAQLPPTFALSDADESWDKRFPKLPLQRKLLHIAIYDSIYWIFRPLLLRKPVPLPVYKSFILSSQRRKLAAAALLALESISQLHSLLGNCHTRLVIIWFTTFEAAVLLVLLYADPMFEEDCPPQHLPPSGTLKTDPLQATICRMTRLVCMQAIHSALKRLRMLAEVNSMADVAAKTLNQLWTKVAEGRTSTENGTGGGEQQSDMSKWTSDDGVVRRIATMAPATSSSASIDTPVQPTTRFEGQPDMMTLLPNDWANVSSMNDMLFLEGNMTAGELGSWPPFEAAGIYPIYAQQPGIIMDS
ncbi:hypothetical protein NX059_011741 [Plenodomus lindquistii]|nr:hypothetical protein NX059_011741 [Plenodomus lindquistii]